jgi:hypothetical protein
MDAGSDACAARLLTYDRPAMSEMSVEPRDGDVVVVRASLAPDGRLDLDAPQRYGVIEWGAFTAVSERLSDLPKDEAVVEARLCASERGRDAWDATGKHIVRLPRLPLVYRGAPESYSVSVDVTDYSETSQLRWKSASSLTEAEAVATMQMAGVPRELATALLGKAPMPEACS